MDTPVREQLRSEPGVSLEDVFKASYRRLVVQLYGVVGDRAEAEDVVQEAFVRAAAAGRRFTVTANPEAWLRTTAINLHRSRWRRLRNFSRIKERLAAPQDVPGLDARIDVIQALRSPRWSSARSSRCTTSPISRSLTSRRSSACPRAPSSHA